MDSYGISEWQGYLTRSEIDLLRTISGAAGMIISDPVMVNIGAGAGTSCFALLEGCPAACVYSVDIRADEAETMTNEHIRLREADESYRKRAIRIWGDSKLVGVAWPKRYAVDVLFIDGDHGENGVRGDILAWEGAVKAGGWILFHDYGNNTRDGTEQWPAVRKVVDEWSASRPGVRMVARADMIIAFRKNE